ncbi:MAG: insulinase family protein [bacterium]|nr:insulinase family protein [bacterium]
MKKLYIIPVFIIVSSIFLAFGLQADKTPVNQEQANSFRLPEYEKFKLANGLTVYLLEQHEVPLIYVSAVFPAGAVKDNDKFGLASMTADAMLFGTKDYKKQQIEETLDFIGASYGTFASLETAALSMSFINKDIDSVFPIMKDIIVNPVFDEAEFDKRKTRLLLELERAKESPSRVINSYYNKFLYEDHVYGNPVSGTQGTVGEITVDDLKDFYMNNYKPGESALAVTGDFESSEMKNRLKELFGDWKVKGKSAKTRKVSIPSLKNNRILLINKDDSYETRFLIGGFGIKRDNKDYVAIQVINTILGGRFTSWLNDELRVNAGLTYGARSSFRTYKNSGTFVMSSYTRTEKTIEAIDLALEVLDRLHTQGLDEETLSSAKNYIKGQYPPRYETAGSLAGLLTSMFVYGYDESFINNFQKDVDELSLKQAGKIIEKYFPKDNLQFVLIGKASEIRDKVKKYGDLVEKDIKAEGY